MAEVIGLAASIAGVITLSAQVTALSYKYLNGVKNASKDINRLINELTSLSGILMALQAGASTNWTTRFNDRNSSDSSTYSIETLIPECTSLIEELRMKLEMKPTSKQDPTKATVGVFRSLLWPVKEKETIEYVQKLERLKTLFTLAISVENLTTSTHVASKLPELERTIAKVATSQDTTKKQQVLSWISCLDPTLNHQQASKLKTTGTGQWLFDNRDFQAWAQGENETPGRLWLHGTLGSGKSILISMVIDYLKGIITKQRHSGLAYFYFDFQDNHSQDGVRFLGSIVCQLLRSQPLLGKAEVLYDTRYPEKIGSSDLKSLFIEATCTFETVYIVVDAMDECKQWNDLHDFISLITSMGRKVQFLASSRKERYIEEILRPAGFSCIALEEKIVDNDIALHVKETITKSIGKRFHRISPTQRDEICSEICMELTARSKGSFRWVKCQIDSIASCTTRNAIRSALTALPKTLNETYERILNSIKEDDKETARRALLWLVLSKSPMTIQELAEAVKIEPRQFKVNQGDLLLDPDILFDICPSMMIERSDGKLGLAHYSVQEYLVSKIAKDFYVDTVKGNAEIASVCLTYMLQEDLQKTSQERGRLIRIYESPNSPFPLLTFTCQNWFRHILDEGIEELIEDLIIQFLLPKQSPASIGWQQLLIRKSCERCLYPVGYLLEDPAPYTLHRAVFFNLSRSLDELLSKHQFDIDQVFEVSPYQKESPLSLAVSRGLQKIAEILLKAGANPNSSSPHCLLDASIYSGSVSMTRLLLNYGAVFPEGRISESAKAFRPGFDFQLAELCFSHNVYDNHLSDLLSIFISHARWRSIDFLIEIGVEIPRPSGHAFESLVSHDSPCALETLTLFLQRKCYNMTDLQPALIKAAALGKDAFIHLLLRYGADINGSQRDINGSHRLGYANPLVAAVKWCQKDTVLLLLSLGADPNLKEHNENALHAVRPSRLDALTAIEIMRALLEKGADVNFKCPKSRTTALTDLCSRLYLDSDTTNLESLIYALLEAGADPDPMEDTDWWETPIICAAKGGSEKLVQSLLSRNVKLNKLRAIHGIATPLIASCLYKRPTIVQRLLDHGADPNIHGGLFFNALHAAVCIVFDREPKNPIETQQIKKDAEEIIHLLIRAGADLHAQGGDYGTVLIAACSTGNEIVVRYLISLGLDVNVQYKKRTALVCALRRGCHDVARLLISQGADISLGAPMTAVIQSKARNPKIIKYLLEHGAKLNPILEPNSCSDTKKSTIYSQAPTIYQAVAHTDSVEAGVDILRVLLEAGADPNTRHSATHYTVLSVAIYLRRWDYVALLEEFGAKEDDTSDLAYRCLDSGRRSSFHPVFLHASESQRFCLYSKW